MLINRRHIRVKVLQTIYAMHQSGSDQLAKEERFLSASLDAIQDLYLIVLSILTEIRNKEVEFLDKSKKKHLATQEDLSPNLKFINNKVLLQLSESPSFNEALEKRKIRNWQLNDDLILILLNKVKASDLYMEYMSTESQNDFSEDKNFVYNLFTDIIAPDDKLYDYLEDYRITWADDIPLINVIIQKQLKPIKENENFVVPPLFRDEDDRDFGFQLLRKTLLNEDKIAKEYIIDRTPNWDPERISQVDTIMLKMAICEFLYFPSIPIKVTINEYLEIAKEYATPKSSIFINGILDNLIKEFQGTDRFQKTGRGLL